MFFILLEVGACESVGIGRGGALLVPLIHENKEWHEWPNEQDRGGSYRHQNRGERNQKDG
jgi:hypothetical protein